MCGAPAMSTNFVKISPASGRIGLTKNPISQVDGSQSAMDNPRQLAAVILTCLLTVGCSTHQSKGQPSASDNSGVQKTDIQALRDQVNGLQKQLVLLRERVSRYDSISLDPTEKGYGRIDTSSGF